jgi:hypothetical protein
MFKFLVSLVHKKDYSYRLKAFETMVLRREEVGGTQGWRKLYI